MGAVPDECRVEEQVSDEKILVFLVDQREPQMILELQMCAMMIDFYLFVVLPYCGAFGCQELKGNLKPGVSE